MSYTARGSFNDYFYVFFFFFKENNQAKYDSNTSLFTSATYRPIKRSTEQSRKVTELLPARNVKRSFSISKK